MSKVLLLHHDGKFWVDSLVVWRIYAELRPGSIDWRSLPSQKSKKYNWQYQRNTICNILEIQSTRSEKYNWQYLRNTITVSEKNNQQYLRNTMTISDKYNWQYLRNTSCKIWEMHFSAFELVGNRVLPSQFTFATRSPCLLTRRQNLIWIHC